LESLNEVNGDLDLDNIDIAQAYHYPKWTWSVGASFKDVARINDKLTKDEMDLNNDTIQTIDSLYPTEPSSIWDDVNKIAKSKSYELFVNAVKELEEGGSSGKNFGVTVETSVDATKMTGDQKLRRLRKILGDPNVFGVKRGDIQVMFHEEFIQACLSILYRGEWEQNFDEIMRRNRVISNARERFIICPRRFGKTWSVAMFCAAFLWCIPGVTVSIFSRGKRMAQKLMYLCLRYLLKLPGFKDFVKTSNSEQIILEFGPNDTRVLCCLPGTAEVCTIYYYHIVIWP
jgi:hypothetical protein